MNVLTLKMVTRAFENIALRHFRCLFYPYILWIVYEEHVLLP